MIYLQNSSSKCQNGELSKADNSPINWNWIHNDAGLTKSWSIEPYIVS